MAIINPEHPWDAYQGKPLAAAIRANFRNVEQLFDLLNNKNPAVTPNVLDNGSDEFLFMMAEI